MRIGIPKEIKTKEARVSLTPAACRDLCMAGHELFVQQSAGAMSGFSDDSYREAGAQLMPDASALYDAAELIVKVKEPVEGDLQHLRKDHLLFCYLHLAANRELITQLNDIGLTCIGFETVQDSQGRLPLLAPMSTIAGKLATQIGATLLHSTEGGKGVLLGGLASTERGRVVVLGAGNAGKHAAIVAASLGADVTVFDKNHDKLEDLHHKHANITTLKPSEMQLHEAVLEADLLVGAVYLVGESAPHLVPKEWVKQMQPGSVIVDIAIDQGGCIETIKPTNYESPTFEKYGVIHFGVTNMPGAVPRTATQALSAALLPYVVRLAGGGLETDAALKRGINLQNGEVVLPALSA